VNPDTAYLIDRPYRDIVDDLLTALVGGVVNEPVVFDVKSNAYPLSQPARDVRGITGTVAGAPHTFQKDVEFVFDPGTNAVVWQDGAARPDDETTFFVDYFRPDSRSPLSDLNVGSVTRTVAEGIGREIAVVYQEVNQAYRSAFVDTAEGTSLDLVVSILGLTRKTGDFAVGLETFFRDPASTGNVTIPEGTLLRTTKGDAEFETTEPRTLLQGQARIDVPIRAAPAFKGRAGQVDAGTITVLAQAIDGIASLTNLDPTVLGSGDEIDEDLRLRARAALRASGKATLAALATAVFQEGADVLEIWDPDGPPDKRSDPGKVTLLVSSEPKRFPGVRSAVHETRAAGVQAAVIARYVYIEPRVVGRIDGAIAPAGKDKVVQEVIDAIQAYVDSLGSGDPAKGEDILGAIEGVKDLRNPKVVDVMAWTTDLGQPGTGSLIDLLLRIVPTPVPDAATLRSIFTEVLGQVSLPVERLLPARDLVQGAVGGRATDAEIEAGTYTVSSTVAGEPWWIALKMSPADVALTAGSS